MGRVDINKTCSNCVFYDKQFCLKENRMVAGVQYACTGFQTPEEYRAEREAAYKKRIEQQEVRLNFIVTAMSISAVSTQMFLEWFDRQFNEEDLKTTWRFERKKAAREIVAACDRIRSMYNNTFMKDQIGAFTKEDDKTFDPVRYDLHDEDARSWCLKLLYDLDRCWQNDEADQKIFDLYKSFPDNGMFFPEDYRHFTKRSKQ